MTLRLLAMTVLCAALVACGASAPPPAPLPAQVQQADPVVREAIAAAWSAATADPTSIQKRLDLSLALDANGYDDAATAEWMSLEMLAPHEGRAPYFLALLAADRGDTGAAIGHMALARALTPAHTPAWWRAGFWLLDEGQPEAAAELFREARQLDPTSAAAVIGLARANLATDNVNAAINALERLTRQTDHPYAYYLLGQALRRDGRGEEAARLPISGTPAAPRFPDEWETQLFDAQRGLDAELDRADRLLARNQVDQAALGIGRALANWPDDVHLLNRMGEVHRRRGDTSAWVRSLDRAVKVDPESFQSQLNLSIALRAAGEKYRAMHAANRATELRPDRPEGHLQVARMHLVDTRHEAAAAALDLAFDLGVDDPVEVQQYAHVLLQVGRHADAIRQAESIVRITPERGDAWVVLSLAQRASGNHRLALEAAIAGLQSSRDHPGLRRLASELHAEMEQRRTQEGAP